MQTMPPMNATLWSDIRQLYFSRHLAKKEIARRLGLSVKTVRKALKSPIPPAPIERRRASLLDPFKEKIRTLLENYPKLSAVRIYEEITSRGYQGKVSILRDYLKVNRPQRKEAFLRIETDPGEEAQVDWALFGDPFGCGRILSCFAFVLSYSRLVTLSWTFSQKLEDFLRCHQKAFHFLGGVPQKILYDNLKSVVLSRMGGEIRFNPRFMAFAGTYLFEPVACNVRSGNEKGKVERVIRYIRENFFAGRRFTDLSDLQTQSDRWRDTVANQRLQATTREKPLDRFQKEKPFLKNLPVHLFDSDTILLVKAGKDARIIFDANTYSVPPLYAGMPLILKANDHEVRLLKHEKQIAVHRRCWQRHRIIEDPRHIEEILEEKKRAAQAKAKDLFLSLGEIAHAYLKGLVQTPRPLPGELKKIHALVTLYGKTEVLQAIHQAIPFNAFGADYLKNIILQNLTQRNEIQPIGPVTPSLRPELVDVEVQQRSLEDYEPLHPEEKEREKEKKEENPHD